MKDGILRMGAVTPEVFLADPDSNKKKIMGYIKAAADEKIKLLVFPELCLCGYTCQDLFFQETLLSSCKNALSQIVSYSEGFDMVIVLGLPWEHGAKLYNAAAFICRGKLLGLVPKTFIPNYSEFYEARHFCTGKDIHTLTPFTDVHHETFMIPFDTDLLFSCRQMPSFVLAGELCEDVWVPCPPSIRHACSGATVIANCSASDEAVGKAQYRRDLIKGQSARLICAYVYSCAGEGESTQDVVFSGHSMIAENGSLLAESKRFLCGMIFADADLWRIVSERRRMSTFPSDDSTHTKIWFDLALEKADRIIRPISKTPFVPGDEVTRDDRCNEILMIQAGGLKKRLLHTGSRTAVVGLSGGLDSTLALLVTAKAFDLAGVSRRGIICVTMPCFGTTDRTYKNACDLSAALGASLLEIDIKDAVRQHFKDIGQDENVTDVVYENSQARERTQVLMDVANKENGLVVGTGDLSELVLGWATYNGDHMSMYAVNSSVPKTLVRHLVRFCADKTGDDKLKNVLYDVLNTPVSPELLPPQDGKIAQKTEELVGPYELHDFFMYYMLRFGFSPAKIYRYALQAFCPDYDSDVILKWLRIFVRRFFAQQFKRSCLPDGPKVGTVAVSPRGDLRMPSDASAALWLKELENPDCF